MARQNLHGAPPRATRICTGLAPGTIIYTLDGALPVEYLSEGERIITRSGLRILRAVSVDTDGFRLHFDTPQVIYADGVETRAA